MTSVTMLAPFNESAICRACGSDKVRSRYRPPISEDPCWYARKYSPMGKWPEEPYIHRTCDRCDYEWPEAPVTELYELREPN